jgi:4-coumarate--CoA ligase
MTEVTCSLLGWDPNLVSLPDSVGELNANCHAKIMDADGKTEVPTGKRGEIWVQGPKFVSSLSPPSPSPPDLAIDS